VTLSRDFWQDRRVLLTGHTGFKGAWASLMLNVLGAKACGVALAPEAGPNEADTHGVAHAVETFIGHWGEGAGWTAAPGSHPHEAHALRIDSTKVRVRLGWRPRLALDEAIAWTAEWYRAWASGANVEALCVNQIEKYLTLATMAK